MLAPFIAGAEALIAKGARGITTTCGFLSLFQADLADASESVMEPETLEGAQHPICMNCPFFKGDIKLCGPKHEAAD